ncbi:MAG: carboxypeptidase regulatory-like domain-containing protein [Phycisphaerales bacterium]|nr:carboxypeptidase regulatory-like domain-containing protein [Phycisphaerales bacterium]
MKAGRVQVIALLVTVVACAAGRTVHATEVFDSIDAAMDYANTALAQDESERLGAIVISVDADIDEPASVNCEFRIWAGRRYQSFRTDQVLVEVGSWGPDCGVRLRVPGFHEVERKFGVMPGEVLVLEGLRLEQVTEADAVDITGLVKLEDDASPAGVDVRIGETRVKTDAYGRFRFPGLGAGEIRVSAYAPGFVGMYDTIEAKRGERNFVMLTGWQPRRAYVHWGYQPDGSHDLSRGLEEGYAIISDQDIDRVSFAEGFKDVRGESDFAVMQRKDRLIIRNFDVGKGRPGILRLAETSFDEVVQAPDVPYPEKDYPLDEGDVFVFKCYDGEHYAKIEVLQLFDNEEDYARVVSDMARGEH